MSSQIEQSGKEIYIMNLYRYMSFESFVDIVINRKLTLLSPDLWEDTYDGWLWKDMVHMPTEKVEKFPNVNKLSKKKYSSIFAQCWSKNGDSIPLWNIYSYDKKSIMIHTTQQELEKLDGIILKEIQYVDTPSVPIDFLSEFVINPYETNPEQIILPLCEKRSEFEYENECRIFCIDTTKSVIDKSTDVAILNINDFIKDVVVHPFAQEWYVDIVKSFCVKFNINFNGKSQLYNLDP